MKHPAIQVELLAVWVNTNGAIRRLRRLSSGIRNPTGGTEGTGENRERWLPIVEREPVTARAARILHRKVPGTAPHHAESFRPVRRFMVFCPQRTGPLPDVAGQICNAFGIGARWVDAHRSQAANMAVVYIGVAVGIEVIARREHLRWPEPPSGSFPFEFIGQPKPAPGLRIQPLDIGQGFKAADADRWECGHLVPAVRPLPRFGLFTAFDMFIEPRRQFGFGAIPVGLPVLSLRRGHRRQ